MNTLTNQYLTLQLHPPAATCLPVKPRGMVAAWFMVDGRLTCKWFPVEPNNHYLMRWGSSVTTPDSKSTVAPLSLSSAS